MNDKQKKKKKKEGATKTTLQTPTLRVSTWTPTYPQYLFMPKQLRGPFENKEMLSHSPKDAQPFAPKETLDPASSLAACTASRLLVSRSHWTDKRNPGLPPDTPSIWFGV